MNNPPGRAYVFLPLVFAGLLIAGIFIGRELDFSDVGRGNSKVVFFTPNEASEKIGQVLKYIDNEYVDTINPGELSEKAISDLLQNLDPHSTYIPAKDLSNVNESLEGNFEGVGIEFNVFRDTICVVAVVKGGPSETAGLMAGDKLIKVEGEDITGEKNKDKDVTKKLRGKGGTKVNVSVMRDNSPRLKDFTIVRGEIPIYSIDVAYMLDDVTGYIKLSRFAETSYNEFMKAVKMLKGKGMKNLVFDLRGNGGGLLDIAVAIADEFLEDGKMIVYTKGKAYPRKEYKATKQGALSNTPLVVLVDENSASASEILAGAIQDNDRGTIIGRRSLEKAWCSTRPNSLTGRPCALPLHVITRLPAAVYKSRTTKGTKSISKRRKSVLRTGSWKIPTAFILPIRLNSRHLAERSYMEEEASCPIFLFPLIQTSEANT